MDLFAMIMLDRIDQAKQKGCDGIEFDNADVIIHDSGIKSISLNLQLVYNKVCNVFLQKHQLEL